MEPTKQQVMGASKCPRLDYKKKLQDRSERGKPVALCRIEADGDDKRVSSYSVRYIHFSLPHSIPAWHASDIKELIG